MDSKDLLRQTPHVKLRDCSQEANQYASALARKGTTQQDFVNFFIYNPPVDVCLVLL